MAPRKGYLKLDTGVVPNKKIYMPTLTELAAKYGTDKLDHGYIPFYEQHLPKEPKRILEIGVKEGRSLAMWAEYFPNTEIHGLDLFSENNSWDVAEYLESRFGQFNYKLRTGNQCDWRVLEQLRKLDFDVIIDDGSHNSRDQMMTFFGLFNGKHYFIEDLHCGQEDFYSQGLPFDFRAHSVFGDMKIVYQDHTTDHKIIFDDIDIMIPNKIVCIHATQPN